LKSQNARCGTNSARESQGTFAADKAGALDEIQLMDTCTDSYVALDQWTKQELSFFVELAAQGKGRREIAETMRLPLSEIVRAALKYSMILPS
jgi:hypothetical protein